MKASTEWMVRAAAGVMIAWFGWSLISGSIIQMVNLSLANQALQKQVQACEQAGQSKAP